MTTKDIGDLSPTNFKKENGKQNVSGKNSSKLVGDKGENLACEYLVKNGYKILGRNYRIKFGEIDIIARKKRKLFMKNEPAIHFVEVKALGCPTPQFYPEEHVNYRKQRKLRQLAEIWLSKNRYPQDIPYQIDVIAVSGDKINFFENAVNG